MSNEKLQFITIIVGMLLGSYLTVIIYEATMDYRDQIKDYTHSTWLTIRDWFFQTKFPPKSRSCQARNTIEYLQEIIQSHVFPDVQRKDFEDAKHKRGLSGTWLTGY